MRTDAKLVRRPVKVGPLTPGYGHGPANPGDWVCWRDDTGEHAGRMIGAISAPSLGESPAVDGFLCVALFSPEFLSVSERWINPASVYCVRSLSSGPSRHARFGAWLFGPMTDCDDWRALASEGSPPTRVYRTGEPFASL